MVGMSRRPAPGYLLPQLCWALQVCVSGNCHQKWRLVKPGVPQLYKQSQIPEKMLNLLPSNLNAKKLSQMYGGGSHEKSILWHAARTHVLTYSSVHSFFPKGCSMPEVGLGTSQQELIDNGWENEIWPEKGKLMIYNHFHLWISICLSHRSEFLYPMWNTVAFTTARVFLRSRSMYCVYVTCSFDGATGCSVNICWEMGSHPFLSH